MSLSLAQIERTYGGVRKHGNKWLKNQRNRKIRRANKLEKPNLKYRGY